VIGLAAGIAGSLLLGGSLRALLYDVSPSDPATTGTVALVLVAVAAVACWLPARRATKMALVQALRAE
jgi:ABC-type antimicrobial peptide transport system permease subunit